MKDILIPLYKKIEVASKLAAKSMQESRNSFSNQRKANKNKWGSCPNI